MLQPSAYAADSAYLKAAIVPLFPAFGAAITDDHQLHADMRFSRHQISRQSAGEK